MPPVESALFQAFISHASVRRDRILLITGSDSQQIVDRLRNRLEDAKFNIRRQIVADINIV